MNDQQTAQPISTFYKGYRFRSRLEARWAVFLDTIGAAYEYEPEGYQLPSAWYLPDFRLPEHQLWIEIKPDAPSEQELRLIRELNRATGLGAIILAGQPWPYRYNVHVGTFAEEELEDGTVFGSGELGITQLCPCRKCAGLCWLEDSASLGLDGGWACMELGRHTCGDHDRIPTPFHEEMFRPARAARFERGESPMRKRTP